MKKFRTQSVLLTILFFTVNGYGQKIKSDQVSYFYNKLPAVAVDKNIKNYQVILEPVYEAKKQQVMNAYEQEKHVALEKYKKEIADYPAQVTAANEQYAKEIAEYNKKSLGTKIAEQSLIANSKPVKQIPQRPYLVQVPLPEVQQSYDYTTLGNTYINLEGYQNSPTDALKIVVSLFGYDHTQPLTMDEQQQNIKLGSGSPAAYKETLYHTEFSYRHPMTVKVFAPDGKEQLALTPSELNSYKIYKSQTTSAPPSRVNTEMLIKTSAEKVLQENLRFINTLLNDKYGFSKVQRVATLYYVKNNDAEYQDLTTAFNEASSALLMLQQDNQAAKGKLNKACGLWNAAIITADLNNKKARINKDVAVAIYFNLLEAYFAGDDPVSGLATLDKMSNVNLSMADRRIKIGYDMLFNELKARQQTNH